MTRLLLCQLDGLTPEMSEAAPAGAAPVETGSDNGPEAGGSAPEVLGLEFAALNDEASSTHTWSFVSSACTCD